MNILMFGSRNFGIEDVEECFMKKGYKYTYIDDTSYRDRVNRQIDAKFADSIEKGIEGEKYDCVFTFNYSPVISNNCKKINIPYISFVYDNPQIQLYSYTVINSCNYIFIFDKAQYMELKNGGINTVYYAPLAVNIDRMNRMLGTNGSCNDRYKSDVSFVGSMYNEKHNLFQRLEGVSEHTKGYLDAIIQAQRQVYGLFFLEDLLKDRILDDMLKNYPVEVNTDGVESVEYIYANYFLARELATEERYDIMKKLGTEFGKDYLINLYTPNGSLKIDGVMNKGPIDYYNEMPYVFNNSRINLNITLRSIKSGIPLRAMDVCGAGGFLLSNYQADFYDFFTPGEDIVLYESIDDMLSKCKYYLTHDSERERIAKNGRARIEKAHTYDIRFEEIFNMVFNTHRK